MTSHRHVSCRTMSMDNYTPRKDDCHLLGYSYQQHQDIGELDDGPDGDEEALALRKQYWKLADTNTRLNTTEQSDPQMSTSRPVTCFLHPGLTPSKLLDHLKEKGASDACIVHWMRQLRETRKGQCHDISYNIKLLGK